MWLAGIPPGARETRLTPSKETCRLEYIHNNIHTAHSFISIRRGLSPISSLLVSLRGKNLPGGTEPGFELGLVIQQAYPLLTEPLCTLRANLVVIESLSVNCQT
jgi:hypothetical protein